MLLAATLCRHPLQRYTAKGQVETLVLDHVERPSEN
jgi:hypothetical protein